MASVSCIYGLGDPEIYEDLAVDLTVGEERKRDKIIRRLADIQYDRNDKSLERGNFRVRGDVLDIYPSYEENVIRVEFFGDRIEKMKTINPITGEVLNELSTIDIFPAKHFVTTKERLVGAVSKIQAELAESVENFKKEGKLLEAERLEQRTNYDLEMLQEIGYCSGVEDTLDNYQIASQGNSQPRFWIFP